MSVVMELFFVSVFSLITLGNEYQVNNAYFKFFQLCYKYSHRQVMDDRQGVILGNFEQSLLKFLRLYLTF